MNINALLRLALMLCCAALVGAAGVASAELSGIPDFSKVQRTGGGEKDAAVIVAVEKYFALPPILGAKETQLAGCRWENPQK